MAPHARPPRWPDDPRLVRHVRRALAAVRMVDPLTTALIGDPPGLPVADRAEERIQLSVMAEVAADLEALGRLSGRDDELDRVALIFGLRRATAAPGVDRPLGARALERHLLFHLSQVATGAPGALDSLRELVVAAPGILAASRGPAGGSAAAGHLALEAARRLPAILDACAGAVASLPVSREVRLEVEAGLGKLLQAAAEDSGWLLKEYIPAAGKTAAEAPDPSWAGLGYTLQELEAEGEAALAGAVADRQAESHDPTAVAAGSPAELPEVRQAWTAAADRCRERFHVAVTGEVEVREAPAWLRPLLPPLGLVLPGPLVETALVLVSGQGEARLEQAVDDLYRREFLPAAAAAANLRVARALLPAAELAEGWRAFALPGGGHLGETAWRAALGLAAVGMVGGRIETEQAAEMIVAESGMPVDHARLQAMAVSEHPLAAMTFLAGRRALREGASLMGEVGVAAWLGQGPVPGAVLRTLGR